MDPLAVLAESRLLPLLTVRGGEDLLGLARVLEEEGVGALEITLRTEKGLEALKALRKSGLLLGAGTVRSPKEAEAALEAAFRMAASAHPGRVGVLLGYDEIGAHRLIAGADMILLPSRFEPCACRRGGG